MVFTSVMAKNYKEDKRYMPYELRAAEDPRYVMDKPEKIPVPELRRRYYAAEAAKAKARAARDLHLFNYYAAEAKRLLALLP